MSTESTVATGTAIAAGYESLSPEKIANEVVKQLINFSTWEMAIQAISALVIILLFKYVGDSIVGYLKFRLDQNIIKGTRVKYDEEEGVVKKVGFFTIVIETENGWLPVATKEWGSKKILKLKDHDCKNCQLRRHDDVKL